MKAIAGIKVNNTIYWFWGESDLWFLDLNKIDTTLISENALILRKGFSVFDNSNILTFLEENKDRIVQVETLRRDIEKEEKYLFPILFIDFDNKIFYDNFPEPNSYSSALNVNWTYSYEDLNNVVNKEEQYWKTIQ